MADDNLELAMVMGVIRDHVARAVAATKLGLKPFAKKNGMGETVVRDLLKSHHKDVQLGTLAKIAKGAEIPLVDLIRIPSELDDSKGVALLPTEAELEAALRDTLPDMPEGELDKRARFLAEAVARALTLPKARPTTGRATKLTADEEGAPPPEATN